MIKLAASDLREYRPTLDELSKIKRKPIYIICDNILDTYNIGAIFRLADAAAVSGVYLVGGTSAPTDPLTGHKVHKASVGTWQWTPWKHTDSIAEAIEDIKILRNYDIKNTDKKISQSRNIAISSPPKLHVVAIEQSPKSVPYTKAHYDFPIALILGHETTGVSEEGLNLADQIVEIPMFGVNISLNVMVSLAIVMWEVLKRKEE